MKIFCAMSPVGVVEHDRGIVAAELERQALQRVGDAGHDFPAGGGRTGERHLGDARVLRQQRSEIVLIDQRVDDAGGRSPRAELAEPQRGQRRRRGGLQHHRVAGEQCRRKLVGQQDQREIPRHDRGHDAQRGARLDGAASRVFVQHLVGQLHRRKDPQDPRAFAHLEIRAPSRLALLLREQR